jgi:hypothetical protein
MCVNVRKDKATMTTVHLNSALSIQIGTYNIDITRCAPQAIMKLHRVLVDKYTDIENIYYGPFLRNLHRAADPRMNGAVDVEELRVLILSFTKALWGSAKDDRYWGALEPKLLPTMEVADSSTVKASYNTQTHVGSDSGILLNHTDGLRLFNSKRRLEDIQTRITKLSKTIEECASEAGPDKCRNDAIRASLLELAEN